VHRALDAGINFIDTANVYAGGESETLVGHAIAGRRHDLVLATKVRGRMGPGANQVGLSRRHIIESVEASLKRLDTDYIDLYQIHRSDPVANIEDTLRALDDLVHAGKVRYIGCSNVPAWQLMKALGISREQGLERFRCTQSCYSLVRRDLERDTIPLLKDQGLGLLVGARLPAAFCRQVHPRRAMNHGAPSSTSAGRQGEGIRHSRRCWRRSRRRTASPVAQAAPRVDPGQRGGHQRHHRREENRATRRQPSRRSTSR
jgi:aryl-alcohol dehydrogenase-like predicted oxidoreductase